MYITHILVDGDDPVEFPFRTYDAAAERFHSEIGMHIMNDDAKPATFTVFVITKNPRTGEERRSQIEFYHFKGFAEPREEKDPNRPMRCPMCDAELDMHKDVELSSAATITYGWVDEDQGFTVEREQFVDENNDAHTVFCNLCLQDMPLDDWMEAYEERP